MIKRGQIYFIRSNRKEQGSEMWGDRPAVIVKSLELREQQNVSADTEKLKRERDLYKDLYERLSNEILGK